jgi:uncharacterized protein YcbX
VQVGTVAALYRYPVKAMGAEVLESASIGWHGIEGDRRYAFVRADDASDFPWLTIREVPVMTTYTPIGGSPPRVLTPGGRELSVRADELRDELAELYGGPIHLHRDQRGTQDAFPVSVISRQAVARIGALAGRELTPLRFRPSVVIDAPGEAAFPEEELIGRSVSLGAARVRLDLPDKRCMVINVDPVTAERDPAVLRAVAGARDACAGVYGSCEVPGVVRVGDPVEVA